MVQKLDALDPSISHLSPHKASGIGGSGAPVNLSAGRASLVIAARAAYGSLDGAAGKQPRDTVARP